MPLWITLGSPVLVAIALRLKLRSLVASRWRCSPHGVDRETSPLKAKCRIAVLGCAVAIAAAAGGCEQPAAPRLTATRAPDVPYEPTPHHVVAEMLELAHVGASDVVYDLGCGDGRIVIAAVKLGARGVCVDIDPQRIRESRANAEKAGVTQRILFLNQDLFDTDIADSTVVTLFLWPSVNLKLRPKLWRELKPGTRVVSYVHSMGEWTPQEARTVEGALGPRKLFLWIVPANAKERASGARSNGVYGMNNSVRTFPPDHARRSPCTDPLPASNRALQSCSRCSL